MAWYDVLAALGAGAETAGAGMSRMRADAEQMRRQQLEEARQKREDERAAAMFKLSQQQAEWQQKQDEARAVERALSQVGAGGTISNALRERAAAAGLGDLVSGPAFGSNQVTVGAMPTFGPQGQVSFTGGTVVDTPLGVPTYRGTAEERQAADERARARKTEAATQDFLRTTYNLPNAPVGVDLTVLASVLGNKAAAQQAEKLQLADLANRLQIAKVEAGAIAAKGAQEREDMRLASAKEAAASQLERHVRSQLPPGRFESSKEANAWLDRIKTELAFATTPQEIQGIIARNTQVAPNPAPVVRNPAPVSTRPWLQSPLNAPGAYFWLESPFGSMPIPTYPFRPQ